MCVEWSIMGIVRRTAFYVWFIAFGD